MLKDVSVNSKTTQHNTHINKNELSETVTVIDPRHPLYGQTFCLIQTDQNAAYPSAIVGLKAENILADDCRHRVCKYLNNCIEQDYRFIKRRVKPGLGFAFYQTAWHTLQGYEAMNMIHKGQLRQAEKNDIRAQNQVIQTLFGLAD